MLGRMKLRLSVLALGGALLVNLAPAFADSEDGASRQSIGAVQSGSDQKAQSGKNFGETFQSSGIRSHGVPTHDWVSQASTSSTISASVGLDDPTGDTAWINAVTQKAAARTAAVNSPAANPITCHLTCRTLTGNVSLIPVYVGNWLAGDVSTWNSVLGNIISSLGTSASNSIAKPGHVLNTNVGYFTTKGVAAPSLQWVANTTITAPTAVNVTDAQVATYINTFIAGRTVAVPTGTSPVYVYIGAKNTRLTSGFGTRYCGWHTYGTTSTLANVQYIAIQDFTSTYYRACSAQTTVSPNGNIALDAMASVFAHEVDETLTDPFINAWYDVSGSENADKCAWTFGTTTSLSGYQYNVTLGSMKYLIQQNWLANNLVTPTGTSNSSACSITG